MPKGKSSTRIVDTDNPHYRLERCISKGKLVGPDGTEKGISEGLYGEALKGEGQLIFGLESLCEKI